jgi:putative transcriptional regulator
MESKMEQRKLDKNQIILTQFRFLLFLGALLVGNWPAWLHAEQPAKTPGASFMLVAGKQMPDPRFRKTVLVVTTHGKSGPIGVIVNRSEDIKLDRIFPDSAAAKELGLFYGGPAYPEQISYLVRGGEAVKGALTISSNIYLAYDIPTLDELLNGKRPQKELRVMHGLATWAPGQLEYEIKLGSWYVMPFDEAVIFDHPPEGIWQELFNRANSIEL